MNQIAGPTHIQPRLWRILHDWRLGRVPVHRIGPGGRGQLKKWGLVAIGLPGLLRLRHRYDLIFVSGFRILAVPFLIAARLLCKRVAHKANSEGEMSGECFAPGLARFGTHFKGWPLRTLIRLRNTLVRRVDAFVEITANVADEITDAPLDPGRVHRIPNAVHTLRYCPATPKPRLELRQRFGLPSDARSVIYTGRLVSHKAFPCWWPSGRRSSRCTRTRCCCSSARAGLDMRACADELRRTVKEHGLEQSVIFTRSVQNVHEYLQAADLFAFPTENGAFPSSVIEAMTTGLPVVTTPVGAIPEIIRDRHNRLLVPPGNPTALAEAIERLFTDPALAQRLGRGAWQTMQDPYPAARVTQRYAELFAGLVGERPLREVGRQ